MTGYTQDYVDILRVEYATSRGNGFESASGTSDINEWTVDLNLPVILSPRTVLLTGFLYENIHVGLYPQQADYAVSTLNLKLGLNQRYTDTWSATWLFLPKISSDLTYVNRADVQFGLAALATYGRRKDLLFKFGALYNTDLFGPFVTPLLGIYFQKNRWTINCLLPSMADINYQMASPLKIGIRFTGTIKSFHLNGPPGGKDSYLSRSHNDLSTYLGFSMGNLVLTGMVGYSVGRRYQVFDPADKLPLALSLIKFGDDRNQLNPDLQDGLMFRLSLQYRLPVTDR